MVHKRHSPPSASVAPRERRRFAPPRRRRLPACCPQSSQARRSCSGRCYCGLPPPERRRYQAAHNPETCNRGRCWWSSVRTRFWRSDPATPRCRGRIPPSGSPSPSRRQKPKMQKPTISNRTQREHRLVRVPRNAGLRANNRVTNHRCTSWRQRRKTKHNTTNFPQRQRQSRGL